MIAITEPLDRAADILRRRLSVVSPMSEDLFRYIVFTELLATDVDIARFTLEYPHPAIEKAEVDAVILGLGGLPDVAIEFKYHRRNPGGTNLPRPQLAGGLLRDFRRLLLFPDATGVVMYLTDDEMYTYLSAAANGLGWLVDSRRAAPRKITGDFLAGRSATLKKAVGEWPGTALVSTIGNWDVGSDHHMLAWTLTLEAGS